MRGTLRRHGRTKPYTDINVRRLPCVRCGELASQQWLTRADGFWRPICTKCDIALNELVLKFMSDPDWKSKIKHYRRERDEESRTSVGQTAHCEQQLT